MSDDELATTQEELAATKAELEQLQVATADREARSAHLESELAEALVELATAQDTAKARELELAGVSERRQGMESQARDAAQRYRELALRGAPELPEELVAGETAEEVEQALQRARETVSNVRGHLESQAQAGRVTVGAPPRSGPDLAGMSSEEKIRYGLQQRSG